MDREYCAPQPVKEPDVNAAFASLEKAIAAQALTISDLCKRLSPVLSERPCAETGAGGRLGSCPVSNAIYEAVNRTFAANDTLRDLLDRLEI